MPIKLRSLVPAVAAFALWNAASVHADGAPACGTFSAFVEPDEIVTVDSGAAGPSTGDRRIGRYQLLDEAGQPVGTLEFVSTVMLPRSDGATTLHGQLFHTFADGGVVATMLYELPDPTDTHKGPTQDLVEMVTGGSGVFAHASGTITATSLEDGRRQLTYDLSCED